MIQVAHFPAQTYPVTSELCFLSPSRAHLSTPNSSHLPPLVSEELSSILDDLFIWQLGIGLFLAKGEGLPQSHPEGPHITCCGEFALFK